MRSTVFLLHLHFLSMKNVRDGVRHALCHGVVSLKSSFFCWVDYYWQIEKYNNIIDFFYY